MIKKTWQNKHGDSVVKMMIKGEGSQEQVIAVNVRKLVQEKKRQEGAS